MTIYFKPPHRHILHWPSEEGWEFDMDATYPVAFDVETKLPLAPFGQVLHDGTCFGLEQLYPRIPWVERGRSAEVEHLCVTGREHRKNQTKMLRKLRQWGSIR